MNCQNSTYAFFQLLIIIEVLEKLEADSINIYVESDDK